MSDYSWIRPGVKAIIVEDEGTGYYLKGQIVTITSLPIALMCSVRALPISCVCIEEGWDLGKRRGPYTEFCPDTNTLKPFKEDDANDTGSWDEVIKIIGVDVRQPQPVGV